MAYMQRVRLTKDTDLDDDTTWRYKLPAIGQYTGFEMRLDCDRHADRADIDTVNPLEACISKVEILKGGGEVVKSLTGRQLDAMNYWDFKKPNPRRYRQTENSSNDMILFLLGGRGLYDKEYGFNMERMGETYLEYTYDLNEGDAEFFAADQHEVTLYAWRWMGAGAPVFNRYFRDRQIAAWTTSAADALKTISIPVGNPIRRVCVQATTRARTLGATFSELELRVNDGEYSPVTVKSMMDWCMAEAQEYGLGEEVGGIDYAVSTGNVDLPNWFSYIETVNAAPYGAVGELNLNVHGITLPPRVRAATTGNQEFMFSMRGWGFQKCLRIGFDHEYDGFDLLQTAGMGSLDLVITEAHADYDAKVFVQDIKNH